MDAISSPPGHSIFLRDQLGRCPDSGWDQAPTHLLRDRDQVDGQAFTRRIRAMGIRDRPTSPRSPWQHAYADRLIGSIRRECVDHSVVFGERHLRHALLSHMNYYNEVRTHLSLGNDAPVSRGSCLRPDSSEADSRWSPPRVRPDLIYGRDNAPSPSS